MRTQIRLADRQGLLVGSRLSWLQIAMIHYRLVEEQAEQRDRDAEQFKYALLGASGHIPFADLFPEIAQQVETDDSAEMEDVDEGDTITYKFGDKPELTPEEMERELMSLLASSADMSANGGDLYG